VQALQLGAGFDTELLDQAAAQPPVRLQRLDLAAGPVQREHEQPDQPLADRVGDQQPLQLPDGGRMPAQP